MMQRKTRPRADGRLSGKRILVVEDEAYIALELQRVLVHQGAVVVGPIADIDAARRRIETETLDAAILDVNLNGHSSVPLDQALRGRAVPRLFVTGYDDWSLPDTVKDRPRLSKPFAEGDLIAMVDRLCDPSA